MKDILVCDEVAGERVPVAFATRPVPSSFPEEARIRGIVAVIEMWCC